MRALIALLLFSYPHDFRTHYRAQIMHELDEMPGSAYAMRIAVDIVFAGLSMRAESLWRDLRFATRVLLKAPLFTIIVISTLALAIAGNAVIFSMLDAVLLKPLPYANAERIGLIDQIPPPGAPQRFVFVPLAPERERIAREAAAFSETASIATGVDSDIRVHGTMRSVERAIVTPGYFHLIGAHAEIGRLFTQSDSASDRTAVISDAVWRRDFGADPAAVGSTITIINSNGRPDGAAYTIRGVLPATTLDVGFRALDRDDVWTIAPHYGRRDAQPLAAILARLKDGATWASARADLTRITPKVGASAARTGLINRITPLTDSIFGGAQEFLWIVFGGVSAVLLIACANIASLLLARGAARSAEFAVRTTLGASARRIGAQLLTEMTVLFAAGAAGGLALATFALPAVVALMPEPYPRLDEARIDGNVVLYVCALTCIVTLVAGIIPTLWRLRSRPNDTLKAAGRNATDYGARARFVLVAVEVAVAFALTVCSGLMLRSYVSLTHVDVGFEPRGVYNAVFDLKNSADPSPARRIAERIMHLAGVTDVAIATSVPFSRVSMNAATVHIAGGPVPAPNVFDTRFSTAIADVSADFVSLMRIPVLAGRAFIDADRAAPVAIVNAAFVKRFVPHGDPIGKHVLFGQPAPRSWRIIGVVGNARDSLTAAPQPLLYAPLGGVGINLAVQDAVAAERSFQIVIRTTGSRPNLATDIAAIVAQISPLDPAPNVRPLRSVINDDAARTHSGMLLLGSLAVLALVLALGGIYGIVSYSAQRRYHEIGIRLALGAQPRDVLARIVGSALVQSAIGVGAGIVIAGLTTNRLGDNLSVISPLDAPTFVAVACLFIACSAIAAFVPAVRAARSDPALTLRYE